MQQATCAHSGADTGTSPENSQNISAFFASRRSVLTGTLGAIGAFTVSTNAGATGRCLSITPFASALAAHHAAEARFCALPDDLERRDPARHAAEEELMSAAFYRVEITQPSDWHEFMQQLDALSNGGECGLDEDHVTSLLKHARHLLERVA